MKQQKAPALDPVDEVGLTLAERQRAVADAVHSNEMEGLSVSAAFASVTSMSERERAVADALHSAAMENSSPSPSMLVDLDEYVDGTIDVDQLLERVAIRHPSERDRPALPAPHLAGGENAAACRVCGTWVCEDCGARRPHANRFSSQPQLCPQCSSASGCMAPVAHRAGRADDHEAAFRQCIAEGLPLRYPLSVSS